MPVATPGTICSLAARSAALAEPKAETEAAAAGEPGAGSLP